MMTIAILLSLLAVCALLYTIVGQLDDVRAATRAATHWLESIDKREAEENVQRAQRMTEFIAAKGSGRELLKARLARRLAEREAK